MNHRLDPVRTTALFALTLASACNVYPYEAERSREETAAADGLTALQCTTHNGTIEVVARPGAAEVSVAARMLAQGATPADAEQNVELVDFALEREGTRLVVHGTRPEDEAWEATFHFRITAPPELAQVLTSHNGTVVVESMAGSLAARTHNGGIRIRTSASDFTAETHNGAVDVELLGSGPVHGEVTSHNGPIRIRVGARAAVVQASTHNGRVVVQGGFASRDREDGVVELVAGSGEGALKAATHNGVVTIR